jgi:hypothetical protein
MQWTPNIKKQVANFKTTVYTMRLEILPALMACRVVL